MAVMMMAGCGDKEASKKETAKPKVNIPVDTALQSRMKAFAESPRCAGQFGLYVYDLTADKPVYGYNEKKALPTASCMKLLSGVAGLHLMGDKYMYPVSVYTRGNIKDGVLMGDASFKAGLDPQFQPADFNEFAKVLRRKGIKNINGKFYVDLALQEPIQAESHWYPWDLSFSLYGVLYKGADRVKKHMKASLRAQGIQIADSQMVLAKVPKGSHCLFRHYRDIRLVIRRMWKNSSNTQATSMLYTIGQKANPKSPKYAESGVAYLRHFLKNEIGVKDSTCVIHDGCGLCTYNHLSPVALTQILKYGYHDPKIYKVMQKELSISGVDGTLRNLLNHAKTRGQIRGKTGTLSHPYGISTLAGFCKGTNGHDLAFALMDSEMSVLDAHVLQRKLCEQLIK